MVAPRASLPLLLRCIFPSPIFGELGNANSKHSLDKILAVAQRSMYFPIHPETVLFFFSGDFLIFHWIAPRLFPSNMGVPGSCHICPSTKCQDFAKFHEFLTYSPIQSSGKSDFYVFVFFPHDLFGVQSPSATRGRCLSCHNMWNADHRCATSVALSKAEHLRFRRF